MLSGQDLMITLNEIRIELREQISEIQNKIADLPETERAYRLAAAKKIIKLKDEKMPVTIIGELIKGDPDISALRMQRDIAKELNRACYEKVNVLKLEERVLINLIKIEYGIKED